jgi:hypothetical protein
MLIKQDKYLKYSLKSISILIIIFLFPNNSFSNTPRKTKVSIVGNQFLINGELTYKGRYWNGNKIEGLLMNSRMVQGIFDDTNPKTRDAFKYADTQLWDPERNTNEFIENMALWKSQGMLAFTINMQGGSPLGYGNNGWINTAFDPKGKIKKPYLARLERILDKADELGMVVILGYFYFGQDQNILDENAVIKAVDHLSDWVLKKNYRNILVEINNECDILYDHKILQKERIHELIERVQAKTKNGHSLLVSTSFSGGVLPTDAVIKKADFVLIHANGIQEATKLLALINDTKKSQSYHNQPIIINEDDHFEFDQPKNNFKISVENYVSWGYFDYRMKGEGPADGYQSVPVDWGINSTRKKGFFKLMKEITGY